MDLNTIFSTVVGGIISAVIGWWFARASSRELTGHSRSSADHLDRAIKKLEAMGEKSSKQLTDEVKKLQAIGEHSKNLLEDQSQTLHAYRQGFIALADAMEFSGKFEIPRHADGFPKSFKFVALNAVAQPAQAKYELQITNPPEQPPPNQ